MRTTPRGWALVLIAFLFYFFANQTQVTWLYVLCAATLGVWLAARFIPRPLLRGLRLMRRLNGAETTTDLELHAGQPLTVEVEVHNAAWWPAVQIAGEETCPLAPKAERAQPFFIHVLAPRSTLTLRYTTVCARRGWFEFPAVRLHTGAPFGLYRAQRESALSTEVLVFPEYRELKRLPLLDRMPAHENPFPRLGRSGEFVGVREYRPGDERRQVHWRSSARAGRLIVKELAEETQPGLTIALDMRAASRVGDEPHTTLELAIKVATTLARYAERQGLPVHLALNSRQWPAPPGPLSGWGLMNFLARVEAEGDESFAACLSTASATPFLVAIFTAPDVEAAEAVLGAQRMGRGVLAILIDPAPFTNVEYPTLPTVSGLLSANGIDTRLIGAEPEWEQILESTSVGAESPRPKWATT
jgi:uncharacterized protein (DUF58 family)